MDMDEKLKELYNKAHNLEWEVSNETQWLIGDYPEYIIAKQFKKACKNIDESIKELSGHIKNCVSLIYQLKEFKKEVEDK